MLLKEKIDLWRKLFYGRQEVFGMKKSFFSKKNGKHITQYLPLYRSKFMSKDSRAGVDFKSPEELYVPLGDYHIESHIKGVEELLIYVLHSDISVRFFAIDFDLGHSFEDVLLVKKYFESSGLSAYVARSTKKGHHCYVFFDEQIQAKFTTSYVYHVFEEIGFLDQLRNEGRALPETFPKTIELRKATSTGYGIKPPLQGKGMLVNQNCWVDDSNVPIGGTGDSAEQWAFTKNIKVNKVQVFKTFLEDSKIEVLDLRMSEKRGGVEQKSYDRLTPYTPPTDGDINLVINSCPAMKRLWNGPKKAMNHDARLALLSWAMQTTNGIEMLRETWNYSEEAENQIQYAIETYQKPNSCRKLQEAGVCVCGRDPLFVSGNKKDREGINLVDYCFKKVPPKETVHGKVIINPKNLPESEWPEPSPVRCRKPVILVGVEKLKETIDSFDKEDIDLGDKISELCRQITNLKDAKKRKEVTDYLKTRKLLKVSELNAFNKEAVEEKKLEKSKELDSEPGIQVVNGTRYTVLESEGYATLDLDKEGNTIVSELCNFEVELEKDIRKKTILVGVIRELRGKLICNGVRNIFSIPTIDWNNNSKLAAAIAQSAGSSAIFRMTNLDKIREAIGLFGVRNLEENHSSEHYGYDDNHKPTVYRSSGFSVTGDGITTDSDIIDLSNQDFAKHLGLKDISKENFIKTIKIIKEDLFPLQDPVVMFTCIAHSLQALIHNPYIPFEEAPVLWLQGLTGCGKTTMAKFSQAFHGYFPRLMNVHSTIRSIEFNSMLFKDALLVIDDYKESMNRGNTMKMIQSFYERSTRGKQRQDGSSAVGTNCRGLVMFTGEDKPNGEASALARCIYIEAPQITVADDNSFHRILSVEKYFPGVSTRFIHYMLQNYPIPEDLEDKFWDYCVSLKNPVRSKQNANRVAQNLAANYLTFELFLDFLTDSGMMVKEEKNEYLHEHWRSMEFLRDQIVTECGNEQASSLFIEAVKDLISSGRYHISGIGEHLMNSTIIGFKSVKPEGRVFLFPNLCVKATKELIKGTGSGISHSVGAIGKQLLQEKILFPAKNGRLQVRKTINGSKQYCWELDSEKAGIGVKISEDSPKTMDAKSQENDTVNMESLL